MTDDPLTPSAGARFVLERVAAGERTARYRGRIVTPEASYAYEVALTAGGDEPALAPLGEAAPAELQRILAMIARLTARAVDKRLADGLPPWPGRVTRWRGPGRGG
jgi:hypothetical protein